MGFSSAMQIALASYSAEGFRQPQNLGAATAKSGGIRDASSGTRGGVLFRPFRPRRISRRRLVGPPIAVLASAQAITWRAFGPRESSAGESESKACHQYW